MTRSDWLRRPNHGPAFALSSPALAAAVALLLTGCATTTDPAAPGAAPAPTAQTAPRPAGAAPAAGANPAAVVAAAAGSANPAAAMAAARAVAPTVGAPAPFADVTRDAKSAAGFLTVWTKDDKTWLEIPAKLIGQPLFMTNWLAGGLGESGFWPGLPGGRSQVVVFQRNGNSLQLIARNLAQRAADGTPLARSLSESYAQSLIASAPLAAAPHPERKSLLVEASALLGGDIAGTQTQLENVYRLPYALDRANSSITRTRTTDDGTSLTVLSNFVLPKLPAMPVMAPGATPPNPAMLPNPPRVVPDPRSLLLSYTYTLAPLPAVLAQPRVADQRVGYFVESFYDLARESTGDKRTHLIRRWRLEKKDPSAAVSEPKEPIRVVLDRNIPEKWRPVLRDAALEWNKAFEKAGFKNAIVVEQQPADADWTSLDGLRVLAMRWFAQEGPGATAVGPSQSDPRTGEILRASSIIPEGWTRLERTRVRETIPTFGPRNGHVHGEHDHELCAYGDEAVEQASMGLELLALRGDIDPDSPEAQKYIAAAIKDVTMHEVGHALGLRHNFKSSSGITAAQLRDPKFTAERGIANSVMDYNGLNIPLKGEATADYVMPTLGAYDYFAIEYGYREFPKAEEAAGLAKIAGQADTNPALVYSTDEDIAGVDPLVNQRDLSDDPVAHAQRQLKVSREIWERTQTRELAPTDDYSIYRRNLQRGIAGFAGAISPLAKFIGGVHTSRTLAGSGQPLLVPVAPAKQRQALDILVTEVLSSSSFNFDPKFMQRLGVDQFERTSGRTLVGMDYSLGESVVVVQRAALDALMAEPLANRLADAETKVADRKGLLSFAEVQQRLSSAAWSELKAKKNGEIDSLRRNLQREHIRRLATALVRPTPNAATDVRAVFRQTALKLEGELKAALAAGGWNATSQAHLADSLATLSEALRAPLTKQGA